MRITIQALVDRAGEPPLFLAAPTSALSMWTWLWPVKGVVGEP